jgi:hypothetical protein
MHHEKSSRLIPLTLLALTFCTAPLQAGAHQHEGHQHEKQHLAALEEGDHSAGDAAEAVIMPGPGKKVMFGNDRYLIYSFDKKPNKLGTVILKVQAYDSRGEKDTSLTIIVDSGMPSMSGMHDVQDTCRLSKKGDYLVPVAITMPGDWEITLTVMKAGEVLFRGSHQFDV